MSDVNIMSAIDATLKETYPEGTIELQYSQQKELFKRISKGFTDAFKVITDSIGGRRSVIPLQTARLGGAGVRAEMGALPDMQTWNGKDLLVYMKNIYVRTGMSGQTLKAAEKDFQAFMPTLELLSTSMDETAKKKLNFLLYRTSIGDITKITTGVTGATTVVVDSTAGLHEGMAIDVYTATSGGTQEVDAAIITNIAQSTNTLTLDTAITCTTASYVFEAGDRGNSFNGLLDNFAVTGTVHGQDRSAVGALTGNVVSSTVGVLTDPMLRKITTAAMKQKENAPGRFWLCNYETRDQIWDKCVKPDRRYVTEGIEIAGGVKTFDYNGFPIVPENDCPSGYLFLIDPSSIMYLKLADFQFMMNAGTSKLFQVMGYDAKEMTLFSYANLVSNYPKANPYVYGITY